MTDINEFHVDSADRKVVLASDVKSKKVFSPMLILALISFQATSVLYGYDDKVIGSVAAMEQFVSLQFQLDPTCKCTRNSSLFATGQEVPRQERRGRICLFCSQPDPGLLRPARRCYLWSCILRLPHHEVWSQMANRWILCILLRRNIPSDLRSQLRSLCMWSLHERLPHLDRYHHLYPVPFRSRSSQIPWARRQRKQHLQPHLRCHCDCHL